MNEVRFLQGNTVAGSVDDNYLRSGTVERSIGLISESLDIDTFTFYAYSEYELHPVLLLADSTGKVFQTSDGKYIQVKGNSDSDPTQFAKPGSRLCLYFTDGATVNLGEFFVEDIELVGKALYRFRCQTLLGIMGKQYYAGGVYTGNTSIGSLVNSLFNIGIPHSPLSYSGWVDSSEAVYGYLPYGTKKDSLMHLLFAYGYVLTWDVTAGEWVIMAPSQGGYRIGDGQIVVGATTTKADRASKVELIEHTYFKDAENTALEVIFSNIDDPSADADTENWIVLDKPYYGVQTVRDPEVGYFWPLPGGSANYMGFKGKGTAYARPYIHQTVLLSAETDATSGRTIKVENEELVTSLNSKNVLQRLVNLQNSPAEVTFEFFPDLTKWVPSLGELANFNDGLGSKWAHLFSLKYDLSGRLKMKAKGSTDFTAGPFGPNIRRYEEFLDIGNHYWTVPDDVEEITIVLGSSGSGGSGGTAGTDGTDGTIGSEEGGTTGYSGNPGEGGSKGTPGTGGKIYTATVSVTPGDTIWLFIDEGGAGGTKNGGAGSAGSATICEINNVQYSSESGSASVSGYTNPLSGNHYGGDGAQGEDGAAGGTTFNSTGEVIVAGGTNYYNGGMNGGDELYERSAVTFFFAYGGGGSGAVVDDSGIDGEDGYMLKNSSGTVVGAHGGDGAYGNVALTPEQAVNGKGGTAGSGGSGGGGGGGVQTARENHAENSIAGTGGLGGDGSKGGQGGNGWAVILY